MNTPTDPSSHDWGQVDIDIDVEIDVDADYIEAAKSSEETIEPIQDEPCTMGQHSTGFTSSSTTHFSGHVVGHVTHQVSHATHHAGHSAAHTETVYRVVHTDAKHQRTYPTHAGFSRIGSATLGGISVGTIVGAAVGGPIGAIVGAAAGAGVSAVSALNSKSSN